MDRNKQNAVQRLFIAVALPSHIKQELHAWCSEHKRVLPFRKWTHKQDVHITLQFLGDTTAFQYEKLTQCLAEIKQSAFQLQLDKLGVFGSPSSPRILWAGLTGDVQALQQLQQQVVNQTSQCGFIAEQRPYRPHITIARYFDQNRAETSDATRRLESPPSLSPQPESQLTSSQQVSLYSISSLQQLLKTSKPKPILWTVDSFCIMKTELNKQPSYQMLDSYSLHK